MITKGQIEAFDPWVLVGAYPRNERGESLVAEIKHLALLGLSMQWRPIETAPRDGTVLLVCRAGSYPAADFYDIAHEQWRRHNDATHWMPLPEAPR